MIISRKKFRQSIDNVAKRYEESMVKMRDEANAIQEENERRQEEYELILKEYDELHGVHHDGEYLDMDGKLNMKIYFQRKKEIYNQGIADGESPFLS